MSAEASIKIVYGSAALSLALLTLSAKAQLPISGGGTGASTAIAARSNLGLPVINVTDFGAVGDGSTPSGAAINNAITACATRSTPPLKDNGCELYVPSGIYLLETGLIMQSYVHIRGDGWATSVLQLKPGVSADVLTVPANTFNFSIVGVTLDGNSTQLSRGTCLAIQASPSTPAFQNTANKQTATSNSYKYGYIAEDMFSNCINDGISILPVNFELWFDDFYVYDNGMYGIYTQGTDSLFSNFVSEHNGVAGLHVANSNNKFINAKIIWNGFVLPKTEAAVVSAASRNIFIGIEAQDNYVSGFLDTGSDNQFIGCQADTNGYADTHNNSSSHQASGFVISGTNGVYSGDKVTDYFGLLPDGSFATQWPYTITNGQQSKIDISFDGTNQPPTVVAGDIIVSNNTSVLPAMGTATSFATDAISEPLAFRGSFWTGSVALNSDWTIQHILTSGFDQIAFNPPALGTYPGTPAVILPQIFPATSSSGNSSGVQLKLQSSVWNGSGASFPGWIVQSTVGPGTNPNSVLTIAPYSPTGTPSVQINSSLQWGSGASIASSNAVPQVGTPAVGQAACIKSAGPPVVIGFCSTSVSPVGTCTCN